MSRMNTVNRTRVFYILALWMIASVLMFTLAGCKDDRGTEENTTLYGTWVHNERTEYTFQSNGNGNLGHGDHGHAFSYEITGDTLTILLLDSKNESEYRFVLEGDSLTLTGTNGTKGVLELTRKK